MANIRFKISANAYGMMMNKLEDATKSNSDIRNIIDNISENAYISNDCDAPVNDLTVQVRLDSDNMNIILPIVMNYDGGDVSSDHLTKILKIFYDRLESEQAEAKKQAEYDTWLQSCFDKYVVDAETPTCKELAVIINNNCLMAGQEKIKYQNIMRPLKTYRQKKFK